MRRLKFHSNLRRKRVYRKIINTNVLINRASIDHDSLRFLSGCLRASSRRVYALPNFREEDNTDFLLYFHFAKSSLIITIRRTKILDGDVLSDSYSISEKVHQEQLSRE